MQGSNDKEHCLGSVASLPPMAHLGSSRLPTARAPRLSQADSTHRTAGPATTLGPPHPNAPHLLTDELVGLAQHIPPVRVPEQDPFTANASGEVWVPKVLEK